MEDLELRMSRAKFMWRIDSQISFLLCVLSIAFRFKVVMKNKLKLDCGDNFFVGK